MCLGGPLASATKTVSRQRVVVFDDVLPEALLDLLEDEVDLVDT